MKIPSLARQCLRCTTATKIKKPTFDFYGTSTHSLFLGAYNFKFSDKEFVPLFSATGGSMIYRKKLVDFPFDKDYFIYNEDSYFGWLLHLMGYDCAMATKSIVYHEGEATLKQNKGLSNFYAYLGERNRVMNLLIFYSPLTFIKLLPLTVTTTIILNLFHFRKIPQRLKAYLWILTFSPKILAKRIRIQKQRRVSDDTYMMYMSAKLFDERFISNGAFRTVIKGLNQLSFAYCKLLGLKSVELNREEAGFK